MTAAGNGLEVRFWRSDPRLARYVSGYHCYVIGGPAGRRLHDLFFPAWMNLRFTYDAAGPWTVRLGRRSTIVPPAAFFGPTSHAGYLDAPTGTLIGAGLTPSGWARLFGGDVSPFADRIVPLDAVTGAAPHLFDALRDGDPAAVFDAFFLDRLARRPAEDPLVAAITERIADPAIQSVAALAASLAVTPRRLLLACRRDFGFAPKLLLRRARFLRALMILDARNRGGWAEAARAAGYWDGSHFLRDCHNFLGCTPSTFLALPRPMSQASMVARTATLGAPIQSLHVPR